MLECGDEGDELMAVGGEGVGDLAPLVGLVDQACLDQSSGVLRDGPIVTAEGGGYLINADPVLVFDKEENVDTAMIGDPLEVAF